MEENDPSGAGVKMRVLGFEVAADSPVLGKVIISLVDPYATPLSQLEQSGGLPPTYRETWALDLAGGEITHRRTRP